jgi:sodium pump decarboxylase gamma subunit
MAVDMSLGERASTSGVVTLQGMLTIFLVLACLWLAIEIMHRIVHGKSTETRTADRKKSVGAPNDDAAIAAAIATAIAASEDDGAVVAAITAAITAMRAEEGSTTPFRVVSFKRAANTNRRRSF